jgi:deazaflavin-dependent oxidoreductase (nitroreductase family)
MSAISMSHDRALRARRAFFSPLTRLLNPTILRIAGRSDVPLLGVVSHRGRRSGRTYWTPVGIGSTGEAFLVPLTFGASSDWCRNVLAAGGCIVRFKGRAYATDEARLVNDVFARQELNTAFGPVTRGFLRAQGTRDFLRLRVSRQDSTAETDGCSIRPS